MGALGSLRARLGLMFALISLAGPALAQGNYTLFESGPVRPLARSADGSELYVCNIPDGRLEIFDVSAGGELVHSGSVQVGVDPVAVAVSPSGEVWVVNHLSDSISIVDVSDAANRRVVRTLHVGDEPRDIVFAGAGRTRAFITTARRGQNRPPSDPLDPDDPMDLLQPGIGRADVWVFESTNLGPATSLGGDEIAILTLFGDTPRALAVTPDDLTVYAAIFHSGNQTTSVTEGRLPTPDLPSQPAPMPLPIGGTLPAPEVGVMLKYDPVATAAADPNTFVWRDVLGDPHENVVRFSLPDYDVFAIDANALTLNAAAVTASIPNVGTVLFNMVVHPTNGTVYVSNTEANNMDRFEGSGSPTLRGELHRAQITRISGGVAQQLRLNPHIDYTFLGPQQDVNDRSLAIPTEMAISSSSGVDTLYVAAFGSRKIGIIDITGGAFDPTQADQVELSGGGPGGVVLDDPNDRLYVLTRFDNAISVVDTSTRTEISHTPIHSPEATSIVEGRRFLYDSRFSSSNGEASCASCHIFGDFDSLAWDLGNGEPNAPGAFNNNPFVTFNVPFPPFLIGLAGPNVGGAGSNLDFHPLKGPMTTQTLRGMDHGGPMHWRGDRSGGTAQAAPVYAGTPGALDETLAFQAFNPAFHGLLGRQEPLIDPNDMMKFTNFILQVQQPPNPIRNLDNSLTTFQTAGRTFYNGPISDTLKNCNGCHTLDASIGAFGGDGKSTFEGETQHFKVAHLRNAYQKVGMFGQARLPVDPNDPPLADPNAPQVRGFGYLHDGSIDTVFSFITGFTAPGNPVFDFAERIVQPRQVSQFMLAFDSDIAPIVGQQVTLTSENDDQLAVTNRLSAFVTSASALYPDPDRPGNKQCDLVVKGRDVATGEARGWWMSSAGVFTPDEGSDVAPPATLSDGALRALAGTAGQELTYTCVPPGSGKRLGIDRGGVGDASQPDGAYDAWQCGDVNADGIGTDAEIAMASMRAWLADPGTPFTPAKCNVRDESGNGVGSCDIADVTALRRALAGSPSPTLARGCI